jgi:hypothetical protein
VPACEPWCEGVQTGEVEYCEPCDIDCADPILRIDAGASFEVVWRGNIYSESEMPAECSFEGQCTEPSTCWVDHQAPADTYDVAVLASATADCGGEECTCENDEPACEIEGGTAGDNDFGVGGSLAYPDETAIEIVIQ